MRLNLIPREGSNTFKGTFFGDFSSEALQSDNLSDDLRRQGLSDVNRLKTNWNVNPRFGGPLKKDRLWFFATYTHLKIEQYIAGTYISANPTAWVYTPSNQRGSGLSAASVPAGAYAA